MLNSTETKSDWKMYSKNQQTQAQVKRLYTPLKSQGRKTARL